MAELTRQERIEMGIEIGETLKNRAFLTAIAQMKKEAHTAIILNIPGSLTSRAACVKLQVLDGFLNELQVIINDGKVAEKEKG